MVSHAYWISETNAESGDAQDTETSDGARPRTARGLVARQHVAVSAAQIIGNEGGAVQGVDRIGREIGRLTQQQLRQLFVTALVYLEKTDLRDCIQFEFTLREVLSQDWVNSWLVDFWGDLLYRLRGWRERRAR